MNNIISKNKFKKILEPQKQSINYQPEYKRLGIIPEVAETISVKASSFPRNVRVNSGQNEDLAWVSKQAEHSKVHTNERDNNGVVIAEVRHRSFVNENFEDGINRSTPIAYDEIPNYTPSVVAEVAEIDEKNDFSAVLVGEFVLIFENQILGAGTYNEVTEAIEQILLSDQDNSISPESLIVFKRMQIMTGVLIKDV